MKHVVIPGMLGARRGRWQIAAIVLLGVMAVAIAQPTTGEAQQQSFTYSGQATVVRAQVLNLPAIVLSDTGPIPPEGGAEEASLLEVTVSESDTGGALALNAELLHASTVGQGDRSSADASVASVDLTVSGNSIAADFLQARAVALCDASQPLLSGSSEIARLRINDFEIAVGMEPNQRIDLPNGYVIVNEQSSTAGDHAGAITVNALHVVTFDLAGNPLADVVVASAHADITCPVPPPCPNPNDFVTGGGWITGTPSRARANFGIAGGIRNGAFWGHLMYIDHGSRLKVKGTSVTAYEIVGDPETSTVRLIRGTAEINGAAGTYELVVADHGEPGRGDTFDLSLSNGYRAAALLDGGNIQLHDPCK